jgi:hypothetical protein
MAQIKAVLFDCKYVVEKVVTKRTLTQYELIFLLAFLFIDETRLCI